MNNLTLIQKQVKDIGIAQKLAWKFQKTTGFEFNELYSEALLAYAEALHKFDTEKNTKFSTFAYVCIKSALINFVKKECIPGQRIDSTVLERQATWDSPYWILKEQFTKDAQDVAKMLISHPYRYLGNPPKMIRGLIREELREKGWTYDRIYAATKNIKEVLKFN